LSKIRPKQPRKKLTREAYVELKKYIFERDQVCVFCGTPSMLTPAHKKRRSAGGHDAANNMMCACVECHRSFDNYEQELPEWVVEMLDSEPGF
jgi:5-methylcytosine-specific restriction endonuclease McrA